MDGSERLHYKEEAIAELLKVDHKVNVVAVVGLYRTGKSYLLNRLAGVNKGNHKDKNKTQYLIISVCKIKHIAYMNPS